MRAIDPDFEAERVLNMRLETQFHFVLEVGDDLVDVGLTTFVVLFLGHENLDDFKGKVVFNRFFVFRWGLFIALKLTN